MSFRDHIRILKPRKESYTAPVEIVQSLFEATKGLDIATLNKTLNDKPRHHILKNIINNKTKIETKAGSTTLSWISNQDKLSFDGGDMMSAFTTKVGRSVRYKQVFLSDDGKKLKLNDVIKTPMFGGGRGSGGGAEQTALMECGQCIYAAAVFKGEKLSVGDELDSSLWGTYSSSFDVDKSLDAIEKGYTQSWIDSSILIANEMKKNFKGTNYVFHRGSAFVKEIENKFKELNKAQKPKPFSNINKWSPADIYAVKSGVRFDFNQYSGLGEFTNELKELYDRQDLVGISLKLASGRVTTVENNITGFIRQPVNYGGYEKQKNFFNSKDFYIKLGTTRMQLRTFSPVDSWQGEGKGKGAAAGKIGGGVLEAIMIKNSTLTKFPYTNKELKTVAMKPTPVFLDELYQMYVGLVGKNADPKEEWIKKASAKRIGRVSGADWRFSKFRGMFFVLQLESNKSIANKICDNIAGYSLSISDEAAPHVVYK